LQFVVHYPTVPTPFFTGAPWRSLSRRYATDFHVFRRVAVFHNIARRTRRNSGVLHYYFGRYFFFVAVFCDILLARKSGLFEKTKKINITIDMTSGIAVPSTAPSPQSRLLLLLCTHCISTYSHHSHRLVIITPTSCIDNYNNIIMLAPIYYYYYYDL